MFKWLYSRSCFQITERTRTTVKYDVYSSGLFPKLMFQGEAPLADYINFLIAEKEGRVR